MGTRALTVFKRENGTEVAVLYRQLDGYPDCHGDELASFLQGKKLVNDISSREDRSKIFNGIGCLSAQVIAHFKEGVGEFYLYPAGTRDVGEEYVYTVYTQPYGEGIDKLFGPVMLKCESVSYLGNHVLFDGPVDEFTAEKANNVERAIFRAIFEED